MQTVTARRRAGFLLYAASQFIALTIAAMQLYAGGHYYGPAAPGYGFLDNFLSDLGATRAWSGHTNYVSCALFTLALVTIGVALIAFAGTWRAVVFQRERGRGAGVASHIFGVLSGAAFAGVGLTPFDRYLMPHNVLVIGAFALLLGYVACITVLMARNGAPRAHFAANLAYLAFVIGYVVLIFAGPRLGTPEGHRVQVGGQKIIVYASMLHVIYLTITTRRLLVRS